MSELEMDFHSTKGTSSEEIDTRIEEYRNFIRKSKSLARRPEEMSPSPDKEEVSEYFVDSLTEKEVNSIRVKVFSYWEITKTQQKYGELVETSKVTLLPDSEPTTQCEEAVISFEDAKSEVPSASKRLVPRYDIEQLIEAELKEIRNSKWSTDYSCPSTVATGEANMPAIESMDFTEIEKKAADIPGIAGLELSQKTLPALNRTDVLEVLLRLHESPWVGSSEKAATYLAGSETGDLFTHPLREVQEFRKHLVDEMKIIYERLVRIHPSGTHRAPENVETSNSSSGTKDSSSSMLTTPSAILSPSEQSTNAYPEPTTQAISRGVDDTISSLPLSTMDSNSSASGLINDPVIDMAAAQPKSSDSSSEESVSNITCTSSTSVSESEDNNTLSGISSLPTDPRASVSSLKDVDPRTSASSLRDVDTRTSASGYPRTSVSSSRDIRTSVSSLKDEIESSDPNVLSPQLLSEDVSDDAFLTAPLAPIVKALDSTETSQNPRRRGRSTKEDEDKNEAKRPAL